MEIDLSDLLDITPAPKPVRSLPAVMTEQQLADFLGVEPSTIRTMAKDKVAVRAGRGFFDVEASTRNYLAKLRTRAIGRPLLAGGDGYKEARTRLAEQQAEKAALQNAALRGELVEATAVELRWTGVLRTLRSAMLAVPSRVAGRAGHFTAVDLEIIDREIRDALQGLSDGDS